MDESSPRVYELADRPLSFWLRLAGIYRTSERDSVDSARLRTIGDFEFILNVEGRTWLWTETGETVSVRPGDVVFLPPGYVHGWAYRTGAHRAVHFDFHANPDLRPFDNLRPTPVIVHERHPAADMPLFAVNLPASPTVVIPLVTPVRHPGLWAERMAALAETRPYDGPPSLATSLLVAEALGWMVRTVASDAAAAGLTSAASPDERLRTLVRELDAAASDWPTVAVMAARIDMGETAFRAAFLRLTGKLPRDYVEARRIERAKHLLIETDRSIKAIALSEGYDDQYHFSRVFKRVTGFAPAHFRARVLRSDG
jgi:AraC-like DNA-binding protein